MQHYKSLSHFLWSETFHLKQSCRRISSRMTRTSVLNKQQTYTFCPNFDNYNTVLLYKQSYNLLHLFRRCRSTQMNFSAPCCVSFTKKMHLVNCFANVMFYKNKANFSSLASSKFTIENPVYASFLRSLLDEYNHLSEQASDSEKLHRFNFLKLASYSIQELEKKFAELTDLQSMLAAEEDTEMKVLIDKEIGKLRAEMQKIEEELADILVGEDSADRKDIIMEINAGVGGQEAMLFCAELFQMYRNYAHYKGWTVTGLAIEENDIGGTRKAEIEINGESVYKHLKHEAGVHRVQRIPKTEKAGRIHTSTVTVSVLPQPSEVDIDIQPNDLRVETFRCGGPGGQHVNKTDSAVRMVHIPTGTVSECRQERSQIKNREIALKNLKMKLYQAIREEEENKRKVTRKLQVGTSGRSEKIRTYNFQQDRITDHRSKEDFSNLPEFMLGGEGLDELVNSLSLLEKFQLLESMLDSYLTEFNQKSSKR